ncbi:MAG: cytochrome P450, partial [Cyanobacteria bacterium P01_C01_bin.121]
MLVAHSMTLPNPVPASRLKSLLNWLGRPYAFLDECIQQHGDIFTIHFLGFPPLVFMSNPDAIKEIFAVDARQFDAGRSNDFLKPLLGQHSLVLLDGDRHKRERKMLMPPFHGAKVIGYGETICQITADTCAQWKPQQTLLASEAMPEITMEVILQTVFGLRAGDRYQKLKSLLVKLLNLTGSPLSASLLFFPWLQKDLGQWSPWGKVVRMRQQVYALLQAEIDERRALSQTQRIDADATGKDDVLSLLLLAEDEAGQPMSDDEIKDELITMLVAGHETTASVLCWAMYWVHKRSDVKAKLMAELAEVGENADPITLAKLPYLTAVASETLRLYPIVPIIFPRIAKETVTIQGHTYPPETVLSPCIYAVHHREDLYPDPKQFKPERFLERQYSPSEFIPFGGGNRRCLGYSLAKLEINLILATILKTRSLTLANDAPVTPRRRGVVIA